MDSRLVGSPVPTFRLVPEADDHTAGKYAIELASGLGFVLDPWQSEVLLAAMGRNGGRWVADEVGLIVPRQNGKSLQLAFRALWGALSGETVIWTAHLFSTARESFRLMSQLVEHPGFRELKPRVVRGRGEEAVEFPGAGRVLFLARSRRGGRGLSPDCIILDEAFELDDLALDALKPSLSAAKAPQLWYASSAPHVTSTVLRRLAIRGRRGEGDRLAYFEWCAPDDSDPQDPAAWAAANPALGIRLSAEFTRSEQETMDPEGFARERLGIWHEEAHASAFPGWADLTDAQARPPKGAKRAIAVDVSPDRRRAAIGAAGRLEDGRILVEVLDAREGAAWAVERVAHLYAKHRPTVVVDGAGQSQTLIAGLKRAGVKVTRTDARQMVAACGGFHDLLVEGRLAHLGQGELAAAVEGARQRDLGDGWAWSRRTSAADITPLVACTLAAFGVESVKPARKIFVA